MFSFSAYDGLSFLDQMLHGFHVMLCAFAVLIGCVPLMLEKGSVEHKFAGKIYLPVSFVALLLASYMAWRESSVVLFCFNAFCTYLLMSGWRAVHERAKPSAIDYMIPGSLFVLAIVVVIDAMMEGHDDRRSLYLSFFALNALYLSWRDWKHLQQRLNLDRCKMFFVDIPAASVNGNTWMGRHIAGMIGSMMANLSVVILTLLPLGWHWLWPATLTTFGLIIAARERIGTYRLRQQALAPLLKRRKQSLAFYGPESETDIRKAA